MPDLHWILEWPAESWLVAIVVGVLYLVSGLALIWIGPFRGRLDAIEQSFQEILGNRRRVKRPKRADLRDDNRWRDAISRYQKRLSDQANNARSTLWEVWKTIGWRGVVLVALATIPCVLGFGLLAFTYQMLFHRPVAYDAVTGVAVTVNLASVAQIASEQILGAFSSLVGSNACATLYRLDSGVAANAGKGISLIMTGVVPALLIFLRQSVLTVPGVITRLTREMKSQAEMKPEDLRKILKGKSYFGTSPSRNEPALSERPAMVVVAQHQ